MNVRKRRVYTQVAPQPQVHDEPCIYLFARHIDGHEFMARIPCREWAEAQKIADENGWRLEGILIYESSSPLADIFVRARCWLHNFRARRRPQP